MILINNPVQWHALSQRPFQLRQFDRGPQFDLLDEAPQAGIRDPRPTTVQYRDQMPQLVGGQSPGRQSEPDLVQLVEELLAPLDATTTLLSRIIDLLRGQQPVQRSHPFGPRRARRTGGGRLRGGEIGASFAAGIGRFTDRCNTRWSGTGDLHRPK